MIPRGEKYPHWKEYLRQWKQSDSGRLSLLKWQLKRFNLTVDNYHSLSQQQNHVCYLCSKPNMRKGKQERLGVDYDHVTGQVRKLLCDPCNRILGYIEKNPDLVHRMLQYLKDHA